MCALPLRFFSFFIYLSLDLLIYLTIMSQGEEEGYE